MATVNETASDTANVTDRVNEAEYVSSLADSVTLLGAGLTFLVLATADATSAIVEDDFLNESEAVTVTVTVTPTVRRNMALGELVAVRDRWTEQQTITAATSGTATSAVVSNATVTDSDSAQATSAATLTRVANLALAEAADVQSAVGTGFSATGAESATATSAVVDARSFAQTGAESAAATSAVSASTQASVSLSESSDAVSAVSHTAVTNGVLAEVVSAASVVDFIDPTAQAWVMNTETTAMSRYEGVDFTSFAIVDDVLYAVAPDGVYTFDAADDVGVKVRSTIETGRMDFGMYQHKRVPNVYFGYEADGQLQLKVDTYGEQGPLSYTYYTTVVPALQPVNTRLAVGKGLVSAYWKFTLSNRNGAYFALDKWAADVAISPRRV